MNILGWYKWQRHQISYFSLEGEQHQLSNIRKGELPMFKCYGIIKNDKHMDIFLAICDIYGTVQKDFMVKVLLPTLVGLAYDWYLMFPKG